MISEYTGLFRKTLDKWVEDDGITNSAALSFHAVIGLPSLILFTLFLGSVFLKQQFIEASIITDVSIFADDIVITALHNLFTQLSVDSSFSLGIIFSFAIYLWSAGNIFFQLQKMINKMWGLESSAKSWLKKFVRKKMSSLIAAIVFGMLVALSTLFEVIFFAISDNLESTLSLPTDAVRYASLFISFFTLVLFFMYLYRVLPEATLGLKYVFIGSLLTVILLTIGKYIMGLYLSYSNLATLYGTIGSILVIFMWIYMSSIFVTFMVEFTGVYSESGY
ncbi:MAG: YihY/virulence factor BrkB family protein [Methanolobus sp.]|nr:YihY/virulence factor BrkB family protein [Methanolobus sp.]